MKLCVILVCKALPHFFHKTKLRQVDRGNSNTDSCNHETHIINKSMHLYLCHRVAQRWRPSGGGKLVLINLLWCAWEVWVLPPSWSPPHVTINKNEWSRSIVPALLRLLTEYLLLHRHARLLQSVVQWGFPLLCLLVDDRVLWREGRVGMMLQRVSWNPAGRQQHFQRSGGPHHPPLRAQQEVWGHWQTDQQAAVDRAERHLHGLHMRTHRHIHSLFDYL